MAKFKSIDVYDRVIVGNRQWSVLAVERGAVGYEDVVVLSACDGVLGGILRVPLDLIPAESIFRKVDHEALARGPAA